MTSGLPVPVSRRTLETLREIAIPEDLPSDAAGELIITIEDTSVNAREFAAYLAFIDRTYGRLVHGELMSYVQRREIQLRISSIRSGSLDLVISELVSRLDVITALIVMRFLLKYLPSGVRNIASAYRDYEEGLLARENRKQLREQIKWDQELESIDARRRNELVRLLDTLYQQESEQLPRARRFSLLYVREVTLRFVRRDKG